MFLLYYVVSFAFISTISFPSIFIWLNIHIIDIFIILSCLIFFILFRIFYMIIYSDYHLGFLVTLIIIWLSMKNTQLIYYRYYHIIWMIISIIINLIMNILFYNSYSRYYCLISFIIELYIIIFIIFLIPDLFIYIYMISESIVNLKRMMSWYIFILSLIDLM